MEHLSCVHEKGEIIIVIHYIYQVVLLEGINLYHLAFKCQCTCWWPELYSFLNAHACTCTWQCLPLYPWGHRCLVRLIMVKLYEKQNPTCTFLVGFCSLNGHFVLSHLRVMFLRSWFSLGCGTTLLGDWYLTWDILVVSKSVYISTLEDETNIQTKHRAQVILWHGATLQKNRDLSYTIVKA